jgi:hypothetical protein
MLKNIINNESHRLDTLYNLHHQVLVKLNLNLNLKRKKKILVKLPLSWQRTFTCGKQTHP